MAIDGIELDHLKEVMAEHLTPSAHIKTPERLYGRGRNLTQIERAFNSQGRQLFIYGDRGVGKSSLALTAATLHASAHQEPIYVVCGKSSTFNSVIHDIGNRVVDVEKRMETSGSPGQMNLQLLGSGAGFKGAGETTVDIPAPKTLNDALDIIRYVMSKKQGQVVIVIDEMERIEKEGEREQFSEFIKNIPELGDGVRFIFCGIGWNLEELLGSHPSAGRILETIELKRLHHNNLWEIITAVAGKLGVQIEREALIRISQISDGFPHYVHLIGEEMFWSVFDDEQAVSKVASRHFEAGIAGALDRTEATLRTQYDRATKKTKLTGQYELALWSLADGTSDRRQVTEIYDASCRPIMLNHKEFPQLTKDDLNKRLLSLKKDSHDRVVLGYGSGWFAFRENIMRGYVRLQAQDRGVHIGRGHNMESI